MKLHQIPSPRLLPTTMAFMAVLLVVKSGLLIQSIVLDEPRPGNGVVTSAQAASEPSKAKPVAGGAAPTMPAPRKGSTTATAAAEAAKAKAAKAEPNRTEAAKETGGPENAAPAIPGVPVISASEKALLQDLRQRRQELESENDALKTRENVLAAAEQKLSSRVGELRTLQKKLETLDAAQKQKEDAGWQGLAKLYEAMKPREAATIFNDLTMPVLLQVMDRMKDAKAAAVMAAMNPDKARDVTAELARLRLGHDPATGPDGVASTPPIGG